MERENIAVDGGVNTWMNKDKCVNGGERFLIHEDSESH